jgi:hypothetical protein
MQSNPHTHKYHHRNTLSQPLSVDFDSIIESIVHLYSYLALLGHPYTRETCLSIPSNTLGLPATFKYRLLVLVLMNVEMLHVLYNLAQCSLEAPHILYPCEVISLYTSSFSGISILSFSSSQTQKFIFNAIVGSFSSTSSLTSCFGP